MKKVLWICIALMLGAVGADAQSTTDRLGVQDLRYGDGWTRTLLDGTTLAMQGHSPVNVKAYPWLAKGDGTTDDTDAIQACVDSVEAWGGGTVYLPAGTYSFDTAITIDSHNVSIVGDGMGATVLDADTTGANYINGIVISNANNCVIRDLHIKDCLYPGSSERKGIYILGGDNCTVERVRVTNCDDAGISISLNYDAYSGWSTADKFAANADTVKSRYTRISGCVIDGITEGSGIELIATDSVVVTDNRIFDTSQSGIRVTGVRGATIANNIVRDGQWGIKCQGYSDSAIDSVVFHSSGLIVSGNSVNATKHALYVENVVDGANIFGNAFAIADTNTNNYYAIRVSVTSTGDTYPPLDPLDFRDIRITNNEIVGGQVGVYVNGHGDHVRITDNFIRDWGRKPFYVAAGSVDGNERLLNVSIEDNVVRKTGNAAAETLEIVKLAGLRVDVAVARNRLDIFSGATYTYLENTAEDSSTVSVVYPMVFSEDEPDTAGLEGLLWYDAANDTLKCYSGSAWESLY